MISNLKQKCMKTNAIIGRTDQILTKEGKTLDKVINKGGGSDEPVEIIELDITNCEYYSEDGIVGFEISNWGDIKDKLLDYLIHNKNNYIVAKIENNTETDCYVYGLQFTLRKWKETGLYDGVDITFEHYNPLEEAPYMITHSMLYNF